ncbi:hypothetical protein [Luteolibacter sp. AS25]|uniref:hypothetical protein n=1 Tax=Luteolibacter sp. AS25 TaxID=3135776 RepID=UPI00398A7EF3
MKRSFMISIAALAALLFASSCESNNDRVRREVGETLEAVTPAKILNDANDLDARLGASEELSIPLDTLPASFAVFNPVEVRRHYPGSYFITTAMWNQHRTGLWIAAPTEVIPTSTKYVTYKKLADRLYLHQN